MVAAVRFEAGADRIFIFEEVYPFRAAQEQAEKKKLDAFGMLAKLNPLNRPKPDTVALAKKEVRYEPFWHVVAQRSVDYACEAIYPVTIGNAHAKSVLIQGHPYEVAMKGSKGGIEIAVQERCHRKIDFATHLDGLKREIKAATLENYVARYKADEVRVLDKPDAVQPLVPMASVLQIASSRLNGEAINAHEIERDDIVFDKTHLYFRPVFAFEFVWTTAGKTGVIEVDGLTGEVVENGQWFKDKIERVMTREMLFDVGAEVAGHLLPGGGLAVKMIDKMTQGAEKPQA